MNDKPRILFVDDEPHVLNGLRRMLHSMSREWEMEFAAGGEAALALLERRPADVVVTDMRMPGMDGATLLERVRERWPATTRLVLSGHSDLEGVIQAMGATHQYLAKPCDPELLCRTVRRALRLRGMLASPELRALIARIDHLPSLPDLYLEITRALADKDCTARRVAEIIGRDAPFTVKLLQLVNSAFFGLSREIANVADAVVLLGADLLRAIVLGSQVFSSAEDRHPGTAGLRSLWQNSMHVGVLARALAARLELAPREQDVAFLAGFVRRVGHVVLLQNLPHDLERCSALIAGGTTVADAERQVFGCTEQVVSAALLATWGLPDAVVEAVAFALEPSGAPTQKPAPLTAVHLAEAFARDAFGAGRGCEVDLEYLRRLGIAEHVAEWQAACLRPDV